MDTKTNKVMTIENMKNNMFDLPNVKQYKRKQPKIGRNELCSCGSGRKYKKCCLIPEFKEPKMEDIFTDEEKEIIHKL